MNEIVVVRHGETEWSATGRHTSRTDLPLTGKGRRRARELGSELADRRFALVLCSPLLRARETCELAGFGEVAEICPDLREWEYGEYEGLTTPQIREANPGYLLRVEDLEAWEAENGRFPERAWVLMRTGWQSRAQDETALAERTHQSGLAEKASRQDG